MAKYCNKCNSLIEDGGIFCTECGSNDIRDESATTKPESTSTTQTSKSQPPTQPLVNLMPNTNDVTPATSPLAKPAAMEEDPFKVQKNQMISTTSSEAETSGSFADVPDFMGGSSIQVPSGLQEQHEQPASPTTIPPVNASLIAARNNASKAREKKKKTAIILTTCGVVAVFLISFVFLLAYFYDRGVQNLEQSAGPFGKEDLVATGTPNNNIDYSALFTKDNSFRVGSPDYGWVSIPNTWSTFKDQNGNSTLQFTDDGTWIVTLYALPTNEMNATDWANTVYLKIKEAGGQNLTASTSSIDNYSAFMVTAYYPKQKKYITTWFFESKSGKTHYLAIEGPDPNSDHYNTIYSFKEDQ
ncbi:MAG: hypothetical protein J6X28_03245 [Bacilli bacterium]|nr:hypothetical protein [Bacilli bacterium]